MCQSPAMTKLRRRTLLVGLAAVPALTAVTALSDSRTAWAKRLQRDLADAVLPFCDTELRLIGFGLNESDQFHMAALVEMHWPPGMRRRKRMMSAETEDAAYEALYEALLQEFRSADPGCFR